MQVQEKNVDHPTTHILVLMAKVTKLEPGLEGNETILVFGKDCREYNQEP